ncbi:MAG: biotin/lipoyl-containing protein, partial [Solirubrobacteraceae bacterium]
MAVGTTVQVVMPRMGDSVTEGTVLEWHRSEGEHVSAGETLVEISTDKVDAEVAAPASGTLVRIVSAEGESVGVGAVLAEIATENGASPVEDEYDEGAGVAPEAGAGEAPEAAAAIVDIVTPAAGESVSEGTILDWTVAVGDHVAAGDTVVEISTDKVDIELPAPASGTITELLAAAGDVVTVGQVIGRMSSGAAASPPPQA